MGRHRFDPVAGVVGVLFVAAAIIVLAGGRLIDEGRILLPIGLVAFGVALLGQAAHPRDRPDPASPAGSAPPVTPVADPEPAPGPAPAPAPAEPTVPDPALADTEVDPVDPVDLADPVDPGAGTAESRPEDRPATPGPGPGADYYLGAGWAPQRPDPEGGP